MEEQEDGRRQRNAEQKSSGLYRFNSVTLEVFVDV